MRKLMPLLFLEAIVLVALVPIFTLDPSRTVIAQTSFPNPANEVDWTLRAPSSLRRPSLIPPTSTRAQVKPAQAEVQKRSPLSSGLERTGSVPIKACVCRN